MKRLFGVGMAAVLLAACQGPKGDQGEIGPVGPQGDPAPPPVIASGGGLTGNGTTASPLAIAAGAITPAQLAGPARIYSRLMTPKWMQVNADIHSARVATFTTKDISFGAAGAGNNNARLLTVPLLPSNTLQAGETYRIRIVVSQVAPTTDNDPAFGLTDGTNYLSIMKSDSGNSSANVVTAGYGNNLGAPAFVDLGGAGQNADSFELVFQLEPTGPSGTPVFFNSHVGTLAGRHQADLPFDRTAALSFSVFANDAPETYIFQSFEVTIDRESH